MIKYYKFNNSRSKKHPFFVYIKADKLGVTDVHGQKWADVPKDRIEITEAEWLKVQKSSIACSKIEIGDEVVILDYLPHSKRYGRVASFTNPVRSLSIGKGLKLADGRSFQLRSVRTSEFIHKE